MHLLSTRDRLHLERGERATARLQHQRQREQEGRQLAVRADRGIGRLGLIDEAYTMRSLSCSVDPSAWS